MNNWSHSTLVLRREGTLPAVRMIGMNTSTACADQARLFIHFTVSLVANMRTAGGGLGVRIRAIIMEAQITGMEAPI